MEHEERIRRLLSIQEHTEQYSDEQLRQQFADDPELAEQLELLALTKQAFVRREADEETVSVEEEWQKFKAQQMTRACRVMSPLPHSDGQGAHRWMKIAASFIGVLLVSGIAFAAIRMMSSSSHKAENQQVTTTAESQISSSNAQRTETDTIVTQPKIYTFNNVPLDSMLNEMAAYYQYTVDIRNEEVHTLRLFFRWNRQADVKSVVEELNSFEHIHITVDDKKLIAE